MGTGPAFEFDHSPFPRFDPRRLRPELSEYRLDCLLLAAIDWYATGTNGGKILANTTFVQRLKTKGGSAPDDTDGCGSADKVGSQRLVPYTADYYFFRKDQ
jgi:hypothetical protein